MLLCNTNVTVFQFMKWIDGFLGEERSDMEHIDDRTKNQKKIADSKPTFDLCDAGEGNTMVTSVKNDACFVEIRLFLNYYLDGDAVGLVDDESLRVKDFVIPRW